MYLVVVIFKRGHGTFSNASAAARVQKVTTRI